MKTRIVKIEHVDKKIEYQIQQRHFLFYWWWVPAWMNSFNTSIVDTFRTLDEAKSNLCYFGGGKEKVSVVIPTPTN